MLQSRLALEKEKNQLEDELQEYKDKDLYQS